MTVRFSIANRRHKAAILRRWLEQQGCRTVLFVGLGALDGPANHNIVERGVAEGRQVVASFSLTAQVGPYPAFRADARRMPLKNRCVDFALANAVIEHVGGSVDQALMVSEHLRVARCWAITTPNRWFPMESHTSTLFRHWSPTWRQGRTEFTRLLSRREFQAVLPEEAVVLGHWWSPTFLALCASDD